MITKLTNIFWATPLVAFLVYIANAPTSEEKAIRTCEPLIITTMINDYIVKNVSIATYNEMNSLLNKTKFYCKYVSYNFYNGQGMEAIKSLIDKNLADNS